MLCQVVIKSIHKGGICVNKSSVQMLKFGLRWYWTVGTGTECDPSDYIWAIRFEGSFEAVPHKFCQLQFIHCTISSWCHSPMATVSRCLLAQVISQLLKGSKLLRCTWCYRRFNAGFDVSAIFSQALQFPRGLQQLDVFQSIFVIFLKFEMMLFRSLITLSLAFVQAYPHASSVIQSLGESDINVNLLVQVDKLVRLLETPIFSYLRLQVTCCTG